MDYPQSRLILRAFRQMLRRDGVPVTYVVAGGQQCRWRVLIGKTEYAAVNDKGVEELRESRDFIGIAAELTIDGQAVIPQRGNRVIESTPHGQDLYDLVPLSNDRPYRFSEPGKEVLRVHCVRILTSDPAV